MSPSWTRSNFDHYSPTFFRLSELAKGSQKSGVGGSSVVRGDRGDAPQARGEARRNNAPRIAGKERGQREASARMCLARGARRSPLCAYCLWGGSGYNLLI